MTTTDVGRVDDERAARLARLQARRGATPPAPAASSPSPAERGDAAAREAPASPPTPSRRRSPATNAKIITAGVSTTAMLGMIAGYGIADGMTSEAPTAAAASPIAPGPTIPPAAPTTSPAAPPETAPPQVIVVLVDAQTGRPVSTSTDADIGVLADVLGSATVSPAPTVPAGGDVTGTPVPAPVAVPTAVDLAVPAAPRPAPRAAPAPQPAPQATSDGS